MVPESVRARRVSRSGMAQPQAHYFSFRVQ